MYNFQSASFIITSSVTEHAQNETRWQVLYWQMFTATANQSTNSHSTVVLKISDKSTQEKLMKQVARQNADIMHSQIQIHVAYMQARPYVKFMHYGGEDGIVSKKIFKITNTDKSFGTCTCTL